MSVEQVGYIFSPPPHTLCFVCALLLVCNRVHHTLQTYSDVLYTRSFQVIKKKKKKGTPPQGTSFFLLSESELLLVLVVSTLHIPFVTVVYYCFTLVWFSCL